MEAIPNKLCGIEAIPNKLKQKSALLGYIKSLTI